MSDDKVKLTGWLAAAGRVAFLLLLVAVGVLITPPNNTIRFHDEAAAIKAIQTIQTMQVQYYSQWTCPATFYQEIDATDRIAGSRKRNAPISDDLARIMENHDG